MAVPGVLAWLSGSPFLFPSLGPTAYLLAVDPDAPTCRPRRIVGGHGIGVVAGLVGYTLFAPEVAVTATLDPLSEQGLRVAASGVFAIVLTTAGMVLTDLRHAPACATTLIVSLGLLSTVRQAGVILVAVVVLVAVHTGGQTGDHRLAGLVS